MLEPETDHEFGEMMGTGKVSQALAARFGLLGLLAILVTLPYALPAIWDLVALPLYGERGVYLEKPTTNHSFYLQMAMGLVGIPYLIWRILAPPRRFPRNSIVWLILMFAGVQVISAFLTPSPEYTFRALLLPFAFVAAFLLILSLELRRESIEKFFLLAVVASIPLSIYAVCQSQGLEFLNYSRTTVEGGEEILGKQLIASTFGHPNYMGSYIAPLAFWCLCFVLSRSRLKKIIGTIAFFSIVAALIVGGTRGAWLGVIVAVVPFYILLTLSPAYRRQLLFAAAVAIFIGGVLLFLPVPFFKVQFDVSQRLFASKEISNRFYYWMIALEMFKEHPVWGVGYSNFNALFWEVVGTFQTRPDSSFYRFILEENTRGVSPGFVHNDFLQILTESGVLGIGIWLAIWSALICQTWEIARRSRTESQTLIFSAAFLASSICIAVDGTTNFPLHIPVSGFLFWMTLAVWCVFRGVIDGRELVDDDELRQRSRFASIAPQIRRIKSANDLG